jgi:hypothetical protein
MAASLSLYRDKEIDFAKNGKFWDSGRGLGSSANGAAQGSPRATPWEHKTGGSAFPGRCPGLPYSAPLGLWIVVAVKLMALEPWNLAK